MSIAARQFLCRLYGHKWGYGITERLHSYKFCKMCGKLEGISNPNEHESREINKAVRYGRS